MRLDSKPIRLAIVVVVLVAANIALSAIWTVARDHGKLVRLIGQEVQDPASR
jgi:hypothetical protein